MREGLLHLLVVSVFFESLTVGPVSVGRVLAVLGPYVALMVLARNPHERPLVLSSVATPAALLGLWIFSSRLWANGLSGWLDAATQFGVAAGYFFTYVVLLQSRQQLRRLLESYALLAAVFAVVGISQASAQVRAVGLQGDANTYAMYEIAAVPVAALLAARSQPGRRSLWIGVVLLLIGAVFASQSRGALVPLLLVTVYLLWRGELGGSFARRPRTTTIVGMALLAGVLSAVAVALPRYRPTTVAEGRGTGRLDIWHVAWDAWGQHPLLGLGAGGFQEASGRLLSSTPGVRLDPRSPLYDGIKVHNSYLEPLVELGPVGLLLFLAVLLCTGVVLYQVRERARGDDVLRALFPMLLVFVTASFFLSNVNNKLLWMLVGFAAVYSCLPDRQPERRSRLALHPDPPSDPGRRPHPDPVEVS